MSARYIWGRRLTLAALSLGAVAAAVLLGLFALGAWRPADREAFVDSRPPPGLGERFYPPENWGWGLLAADRAPEHRYGVAATARAPRAQVLIIPDYGESAETWFETARDLGAAGFTVWILEGVGQGGSGRAAGPRDVGELKSFDPDVAAVKAMMDQVVAPGGGPPLTLVGQGVGALVAARAVEQGAAPAALILSAPDCRGADKPGLLRLVGLGALPAPGERPWRRDGGDAFAAGATHDAWRGAVTHAWQTANPDLRLGGPSLDWRAAFSELRAKAIADAGSIRTPTLVVAPTGSAACLHPPGSKAIEIAGAGRSLELEDDAHRNDWLAAVESFVDQTAAPGRPHGS